MKTDWPPAGPAAACSGHVVVAERPVAERAVAYFDLAAVSEHAAVAAYFDPAAVSEHAAVAACFDPAAASEHAVAAACFDPAAVSEHAVAYLDSALASSPAWLAAPVLRASLIDPDGHRQK